MTETKFVPKFYAMDSKTDDLLPYGTQLENGMIVLIDSSKQRVDTSREMEPWEEERALECNRWATITDLEVINSGCSIRFIAVYEDGSKRKREHAINVSWLVKLHSFPEVERADRYSKIYPVVLSSLVIENKGETSESRYKNAEELAVKTTKLILDQL